MVQTVPSHRVHCAVCHMPYRDIVRIQECHLVDGKLLLLYLSLGFLVMVYTVVGAVMRPLWFTSFVITFEVGCVIVTIFLHVRACRAQQRCCCWAIRERHVVASV